jgi:uncharacterized protein with HEPN domain
MSDDRAHVLDMLGAARAIQRFLSGHSQDDFLRDDILQSAVLHKFTTLGAACRRVSEAFRAEHPSVDWLGITRFRNQIVHEYDDVNLDIVWRIVETDLPKAIAALEPLAPEDPDGQAS